MRYAELKPIRETPEDYDAIEAEILRVFREEIYLPLVRELKGNPKVLNTLEDLVYAIESSKIRFNRGAFTGKFSANISKELLKLGAKWVKRESSFKIGLAELPTDVRTAIQLSEDRFKKVLARLDDRLSKILPEQVAEQMSFEKLFSSTIFKVNKRFEESIKGIIVAPQLTPERREELAKNYTNNLKLYIKDWTVEEIKDLRTKIQSSGFRGLRYETAIKMIERSYDVSHNKAKFLARQETNLLMSKFKESRYKDSGIQEYKWRCVVGTGDHPVRDLHKLQNGKIFSWDQPPVVTKKGERKNPGEDYNCRCTAIPVVKF